MIREIERKPIKYSDYYVARVIQDCESSKVVYKEIHFESMPTDQEIVQILTEVPSDCFISVIHNYRLIQNN